MSMMRELKEKHELIVCLEILGTEFVIHLPRQSTVKYLIHLHQSYTHTNDLLRLTHDMDKIEFS